ncbi:MAG: TrkA C-terminal domain-containing protein, partial [Candidatus Sifarchaeia archaeon]
MSVMLFIIVLVASFTIVRIGAVAFQLSGLEWSLAKFQSLSCFSGTGFTTKEAELITGDKRRRRIASVLMVLGNAGLVTMIATVASALNPENTLLGWLSESFLPFLPLWSVRWVNLGLIVIALFVIYKVFTNKKFTQKLTGYLRMKIIKKEFFK